jgi:murein DD-endopeptidase MepM/ murein hydrolase activator NlpD
MAHFLVPFLVSLVLGIHPVVPSPLVPSPVVPSPVVPGPVVRGPVVPGPVARAHAAVSPSGRHDVAPKGVWPLRPPPEVVAGFDPPSVAWGPGHRGVDLLGAVGMPVHAALAGTVSFTGRIAGVPIVVIDHGGTRTTYQPVAALAHVGQEVAQGQVVGTLEWFGTHCAPRTCLHWGLVEGENHYLDPLMLLGCGPQPVRLFSPTGPLAAPQGCVGGGDRQAP